MYSICPGLGLSHCSTDRIVSCEIFFLSLQENVWRGVEEGWGLERRERRQRSKRVSKVG